MNKPLTSRKPGKRRIMEQAFGHQPVTLFKRYFHAYKVEATGDGCVMTRGWRTGRINRN